MPGSEASSSSSSSSPMGLAYKGMAMSHVGFAGPFRGKCTSWLLMHAHSKWTEVFKMSQTTAIKHCNVTATVCFMDCLRLSYPLMVHNSFPRILDLQANEVKHIRRAPYHPASNGAEERFVRTFKEAMKTGTHDD